jgi:hypothetical protein
MNHKKTFVAVLSISLVILMASSAMSQTAHNSGYPKTDDIYMKGYPGATPDVVVQEFINGVTDVIEGPSRSDLHQQVRNSNHTVSEKRPAAEFTFFPINNRDFKLSSGEPNAPLNDSAWRLALSFVYGQDDKQADVFGYYQVDWQEGLGNPVPPAQEPWYDAATVMPNTDYSTAWNNTLKPAGYTVADYGGQDWLHRNGVPVRPPDGPNLGKILCMYTTDTLVYPQGPLGGMARNWNDFIQNYVGAEGPIMELSPVDFTTLVVDLLAVRDYDVIGIGLTSLGRYADWIYDCFHSSNDVPWGWNFVGVHDSDYDRWSEIILTSLDTNEVIEACENWTRKFVNEQMNWMPAIHGLEFVTTCNNTLDGNHPGILTNVIPMDNFGPANDYTWQALHWKGTPGVAWPGDSYNRALGDECKELNPWTDNTAYSWDYMDLAIPGLVNVNPSDDLAFKLKLMPGVATKWSLTNWTSIPALGITNGSTAVFYLRQDVMWQDLRGNVDSYDCVANMRFLREYEPGRYSSTWESLVYEEADGPYKFQVYMDQTSLSALDNIAGTALLVPEHILEVVEGYWQTWDPSQLDYVGLGIGPPPPKYSFMKQIVGCGPYVFNNYNRGTSTGSVTRFEEYFVNAPVIGGVAGEWRVEPGDNYDYDVIVHNFGAKELNEFGTITGVEVDVAIFEDGVPVHIVNDTYLGGWEWTTFSYTKNSVSCGPHIITVVITGPVFSHTYTHAYVATTREDLNTYSGELLDFTVDMRDIGRAARAFGSSPGHLRWEPIADINDDFVVDMRDIGGIAREFGWSC